jgi:hypothetical protein
MTRLEKRVVGLFIKVELELFYTTMTSESVAKHYNAIPNTGVVARMDSKIYYLRNYNNWMKSMLIGNRFDLSCLI